MLDFPSVSRYYNRTWNLYEEENVTPVPHTSIWTDKVHYLTKTIIRGSVLAVVVTDGVQPKDGHLFPDIGNARSWLKENGFTQKADHERQDD